MCMQPYIEIILGTGQNDKGVEDPQAARLQELVDYVQAQVRPKQFWDIVEIVL